MWERGLEEDGRMLRNVEGGNENKMWEGGGGTKWKDMRRRKWKRMREWGKEEEEKEDGITGKKKEEDNRKRWKEEEERGVGGVVRVGVFYQRIEASTIDVV